MGFSKFKRGSLSISVRLQLFLLSFLFITFIAIAWQTVANVESEYERYHHKRLSRKSTAIKSAVEYLITNSVIEVSKIDWEAEINRIADINNIDIVVFTSDEKIIASSLKHDLIDLSTYANVSEELDDKENIIIEYDKNEERDIIVCYNLIPYLDQPLIIQVPYFNSYQKLNDEIASIIFLLLKVYSFFFIVILLVGPLLVNTLLKPLNMVRKSMHNLDLGKDNEKIEVYSNDEIGMLVGEYNRMIDELKDKADQIKNQERESAWKDMAKQVAHEIKNPLTPMKLSIQHLGRMSTDDIEKYKMFVDRVSTTLIEQIDHLTYIANEFSNFAQIPDANFERVSVHEVVEGVVDLYEFSENIEVRVNSVSKLECDLDKNQLNRVLSNLVKNAVQAIDESEIENGLIELNCMVNNDFVQITVKDNGPGISEELRSKVFVPNFSTKSSGMGIGLPMSKRIIENFGGTLTFVSELGKGTIFTISLPIN